MESSENENEKEVLVVVSKLKNYIKSTGMNTAGNVATKLSEQIKVITDKAIANAKNDGRKTVMDRDFEGVAL